MTSPSNIANEPVPAHFPTTIGPISELTEEEIVPIESYYGLLGQGLLEERRRAVRKAYGIVMVVSMRPVLVAYDGDNE